MSWQLFFGLVVALLHHSTPTVLGGAGCSDDSDCGPCEACVDNSSMYKMGIGDPRVCFPTSAADPCPSSHGQCFRCKEAGTPNWHCEYDCSGCQSCINDRCVEDDDNCGPCQTCLVSGLERIAECHDNCLECHTCLVFAGETRGTCTDNDNKCNKCERCTDGTCVAVAIPAGSNVDCDPVITGFDGKKFHFNDVGEFCLIVEADGWQVDATFTGATAYEGAELMEKSWTSSVRVYSPKGNMVNCSIPGILPNTSRVDVTVTRGDATSLRLTSSDNIVELEEMSIAAILAGNLQYIHGCRIITEKMDVIVYQVSGWEQATKHPDHEAWAAPFTWLNMDIKILKTLVAPVTGILGDTYPKELGQPPNLYSNGDASQVDVAHVEEDEESFHGRMLASFQSSSFPVAAGIVGLSRKEE